MKKVLPVILIGILVLSGLGAVGTQDFDEAENISIKSNMETIYFSNFKENTVDEEYLEISYSETNSYTTEAGKPLLPKIVKTFELPFGSKNIKVDVSVEGVVEKQISKEIKPCPIMQPISTLEQTSYIPNEKDVVTYSSNDPYPSEWYTYSIRSGLNENNKRSTYVIIHMYPARYIPNQGKILAAKNSDVKITYEPSEIISSSDETYNFVIIAPTKFESSLKDLVDHKNDNGIKTFFKSTEEIYEEFDGVDKPEQIKMFIKDTIETYEIEYVLLVGGLKSQIYAKPRDNCNEGSKGWYLPVRYTNLFDNPKFPLSEDVLHDPGVISDLYYADIYDGEGNFSSWDPNEDGIFASWNKPGVEENDENIDMMPDVCLGRLACRSVSEVNTVVKKIIDYETNTYGSEWFNKMTVVSGDGFLDQQDLNIQWDTASLENGYYVIYAQSTNATGQKGPKDTIKIEIDRSQETEITFNHDDHLNPALEDGYPAPPIAEIVSISQDDVLGYNDYEYTPIESEAFCNDFNPWANISYIDGVLTIRGKSYDPQPYGNLTNIHVWIKNMKGETVFSEWRNNTEMYYEGEWTTGEKALKGRGGALYYMDDVEKNIIWTSNGKFTCEEDVINALNEGSGFMFMSGHGSPNVWADHYPGVPGNRGPASVTGLQVTKLSLFNIGGIFIGQSKIKDLFPAYPMDTLSNGEKLPVAVIGGCHNSQFNVTMIPGFLEGFQYLFPNLHLFDNMYMWCHGSAVPECFSWRLVRNPNGGSIATMGNTGLGYGMPGNDLTTGGGDGWITIEFFRQYGENGHEILGQVYKETQKSYITNFDMTDLESGHPKTVQQWVLFGDPTLRIGGIPSSS